MNRYEGTIVLTIEVEASDEDEAWKILQGAELSLVGRKLRGGAKTIYSELSENIDLMEVATTREP